jgi:hypothetical protein
MQIPDFTFSTALHGCPTAKDWILANQLSLGSPGSANQKHLFIKISGTAFQMRLIVCVFGSAIQDAIHYSFLFHLNQGEIALAGPNAFH